MSYGSISLEKRIKENIRNYSLSSLFDVPILTKQAQLLHELFGLDILVTDRHGEKNIVFGNFVSYRPDVVEDPGIKLRVADRTVAHIYARYDRVEEEKKNNVKALLEELIRGTECLGNQTYLHKETAAYLDELESKNGQEPHQVKYGEKLDELTGVLNKLYFENRLKIVDRSQVAPVGAICVNINDWKYANDHYGDEESDRLIRIIADILKKCSKPDYIVGRVDGDVFYVLIPMPEDGECESFCNDVKESCNGYEDPYLAPSVAVGMAIKENVEECLTDVLSDAEYIMFEDKLRIKNEPDYRKRLERGKNRK